MYKDVSPTSTIGLKEWMMKFKYESFVVFTCQGARAAAEPGVVLVPTIPDQTQLQSRGETRIWIRIAPGLHNELAVGKVGIVLALLLHL